MPWLEMSPVEERERFIDDHRRGLYDMTELCARYAVSRKTGYKWLARYDGGGRPNSAAILTYNNTFVANGTWGQPISVLSARMIRISAEFTF